MAGWNDANFIGADWQSCAFLNMFDQAVWEREYAVNLFVFARTAFSGTFSVGIDLQGTTATGSNANAIARLQTRLQDAGGFIPSTFDPTALAATNLATVTGAAIYRFSGTTGTNIFVAAGYPEGGWRRKLDRRVQGATNTADIEGNTAATGQVAWLYGTSASNAIGIASLARYNGTSWTATAGVRPDLLSSDQASPGSASVGICKRGDTMGEWCWRQMRDVANLMSRTSTPSLGFDFSHGDLPSTWYGAGFTGYQTTYAAAIAAANAAFVSHGVGPLGNQRAGQVSEIIYDTFDFTPGQYAAELSAVSTTSRATVPNHVNRTFNFYLGVLLPPGGGGQIVSFDAQTSAYSLGQVTKWSTIGATTALNVVTAELFDATIAPPNFHSAPTSNSSFEIGWVVGDVVCLVDWQFTYGP